MKLERRHSSLNHKSLIFSPTTMLDRSPTSAAETTESPIEQISDFLQVCGDVCGMGLDYNFCMIVAIPHTSPHTSPHTCKKSLICSIGDSVVSAAEVGDRSSMVVGENIRLLWLREE